MRFCVVATVMVGMFSMVSSAEAAFKLRLSNDGDFMTIADESAGDAAIGIAGKITYSGTVGDYSFAVTIADSKPVIGSAAAPELATTINALYSPSGATIDDTLVVESTDTDFGPSMNPLGFDLFANSASDNTGLVAYNAYVDLGNGEFVQSTQIDGSIAGSGVFNAASSGSVATDAGYSVTLVTTVRSTASGQNSQYDVSLSAVPEPASLVVWAVFGLAVCVGARMRRGLKA